MLASRPYKHQESTKNKSQNRRDLIYRTSLIYKNGKTKVFVCLALLLYNNRAAVLFLQYAGFVDYFRYLRATMMKNLYRYIFFSFALLLLAGSAVVLDDVAGDGCDVSAITTENGVLSVPSLSETLFACPVGGIAVPVQPFVNSAANSFYCKRLQSLQKFSHLALWFNKKGVFYEGASCKQHELSSPFYCTPPSRYYVFALRRLII